MTQQQRDIEWQQLKDIVMEEFGYDETDMDEDDNEDEVNRETDKRFGDLMEILFSI
jgi:hypothetical protein